MFSRPATNKLREVFDVVFKSDKQHSDDRLADKAEPAAIYVENLDPASIPQGNNPQVVAVIGNGFVDGCSVRVDDSAYDATIESGTRLVFTLDAARVATPGTLAIVVVDPEGTRTRSLPLTVKAPA
jgi:hypothetical protein